MGSIPGLRGLGNSENPEPKHFLKQKALGRRNMGKSGCTLKILFNTHHLVVGGFIFRCNRKPNPSGLGNKTVTSEQFPSQQGD